MWRFRAIECSLKASIFWISFFSYGVSGSFWFKFDNWFNYAFCCSFYAILDSMRSMSTLHLSSRSLIAVSIYSSSSRMQEMNWRTSSPKTLMNWFVSEALSFLFSLTSSMFALISECRSPICLWISSSFSFTLSDVDKMYCSKSSRWSLVSLLTCPIFLMTYYICCFWT